MTRTFILAILFIIFGFNGRLNSAKKLNVTLPQTNEPARTQDELEIRQLAERWKTSYNAGDPDKVTELYTEDSYYLSAHVIAKGREEIKTYWSRGIMAGGHIDMIKPIAVFHSGNLGYSVGTYQATNAGITIDGRILIVVKKVGGKWLMAAHETVVRDQP
jgi:ketosteroid isomerase-like protein